MLAILGALRVARARALASRGVAAAVAVGSCLANIADNTVRSFVASEVRMGVRMHRHAVALSRLLDHLGT